MNGYRPPTESATDGQGGYLIPQFITADRDGRLARFYRWIGRLLRSQRIYKNGTYQLDMYAEIAGRAKKEKDVHRIKITPFGRHAHRLELNGVDISRVCRSVDIHIVGGRRAEVVLVHSGRIEIPEEVEANIIVEKESKQNGETDSG